jgi:aromatic ring-opening dioxygenase catalytic subunit (LigB family)
MAEIVWAASVAHTGGMLRDPGSGEDAERAKRVYAGFATLRESLLAAKPDVLIVVATDHFMTYSYENMPTFAIGKGDAFETWGEFGTPKLALRGHAAFADAVHADLIEAGFDLMSAAEMRLDHSFACPLAFLNRDAAIPVLPIFVNCNVPPLPSLPRCLAFGRALGDAVRYQMEAMRVAVVGTGGLSHWVGMPQTGRINVEFDRRFLDGYEACSLDAIAAWDSDGVIAEAGNGASEIRNWLIAQAACRAVAPRRLVYEPVGAWVTGIGLVDLRPS